MKSMVIGGIILIIALMGGTYFVAGDAFITDDYINNLTMIGAFAIRFIPRIFLFSRLQLLTPFLLKFVL